MKDFWKKGTAGGQRGAFIVFTALAMWFLMIFVAFAVDFGNFYRHRSQLQNAADAAALAGVAEYTTEEIAKNTGAVAAPTLSQGRLVTVVDNDKATAASRRVSRSAQEYVDNNYGNLAIKNNKVWSEEVTNETTANGFTTSVKTTHRYCRVDLEDTVQTFFARIFGVDSLTVKASALAMLDGSAENETWGKRLQGIAERMEMLAPNQLWETLVYTDMPFEIKEGTNVTTKHKRFGKGVNRYYVVDGAPALLGSEETRQKHPLDGNEIIIGYKEPANPKSICADAIYAAGGITWDQLIGLDDVFRNSSDNNLKNRRCCPTTKVFDIKDKKGVTTNNGKDIFALYLNRDHITQRTGLSDRFTKINVDKITGTVSNTVNNQGGNQTALPVPLYARLESETVRTGALALMPVHGVTIVVKTTRDKLGMREEKGEIKFDANVRPLVIAYDGPDPYRGKLMSGKNDVEDAPWIATRYTELNNITYSTDSTDPAKLFKGNKEPNYCPSEIRKDFEPLLTNNNYLYRNDPNKNKYLEDWGLVQSALTTSGPIEVIIEDGHVLYGAIYAPNSKVTLTIRGNGYIYGFIAARDIVINPQSGGSGNIIHGTETVSLPTLAVSAIDWKYSAVNGKDVMVLDYERTYVTDTYKIAFNYYADFTDAKYYSALIDTYWGDD